MEHRPDRQHAEMEQEHFCHSGNQGMEPTGCQRLRGSRASGYHRHPPYRTAKTEEVQYPFQKDINKKRCLTHPLKTAACFFDFSNGLYFFSSIFQTKPDGSVRMLYSSLAKRFPVLSDNSSPMVPNRPAINNPHNTAVSLCLHAPPVPSPQPFRRSSATAHTRAYLGVLNITHSEAEKA